MGHGSSYLCAKIQPSKSRVRNLFAISTNSESLVLIANPAAASLSPIMSKCCRVDKVFGYQTKLDTMLHLMMLYGGDQLPPLLKDLQFNFDKIIRYQ